MWRVPGERVKLDLDGPTVEVEPIRSWALLVETTALAATYKKAAGTAAQYEAVSRLFEAFCATARPQWDIVDGFGPVPASGAGMKRLPLDLALDMFAKWQDTFPKPKSSAVDKVLRPGSPVNLEVKRRMKRKAA